MRNIQIMTMLLITYFCYGINYYTIMSLMEEHESKDGKSFHKDNADLTNWVNSNIKKKEVSEKL